MPLYRPTEMEELAAVCGVPQPGVLITHLVLLTLSWSFWVVGWL